MKVLVCGGRRFQNYEVILSWLEDVLSSVPIDVVIHGGACGADYLAGKAAFALGLPVMVFPANWEKFGKSAGPKRNQWMLNLSQPNLVLAFPDKESVGTYDMIQKAEQDGIEVKIYEK